MSIFKYLDYKEYLKKTIDKKTKVYGYRAKLAEAASCQRSFLSQVLHSSPHLTLEHGIGLCRYWQFSPMERDYFLALIQLARAGNDELRDYFKSQVERMRREQADLSQRYRQEDITRGDESAIYYSSWHYAAIHMLSTIPEFQHKPAMAKRLQVPMAVVEEAAQVLQRLGLVESQGEYVLSTKKSIHLSKSSYLNNLNHSLWRQKISHGLLTPHNRDFHYTALYTLSREDMEVLQQMLVEFVDATRKLVAPSREEEMVSLCCDLIRV